MAHDSAHWLTKHKSASAERRLALEIRSWELGFVVFEGPKLLDWGVCRFPDGHFLAAIHRLRLLLKTFVPSIAVARRTRRVKGGSSEKATRLFRKISKELEHKSVRFVVLRRADIRKFFVQQGCINKNRIAVVVADRFEQLKARTPRARKPWETERSIVAVFDAAATLIALDGLRERAA